MSAPDVVFVSGPTYYDSVSGKDLLVPFTYSNGKLDIAAGSYPGGSGGSPPALGNAGASVRLLGGSYQVTSLGTTLQSVLRSGKHWAGHDISGAITVVSPGIVTRVQQLDQTFLAPTWDTQSYSVTTEPWTNSNFILYNTVYMFTKPIVLRAKDTSNTDFWITLQSSWDH